MIGLAGKCCPVDYFCTWSSAVWKREAKEKRKEEKEEKEEILWGRPLGLGWVGYLTYLRFATNSRSKPFNKPPDGSDSRAQIILNWYLIPPSSSPLGPRLFSTFRGPSGCLG